MSLVRQVLTTGGTAETVDGMQFMSAGSVVTNTAGANGSAFYALSVPQGRMPSPLMRGVPMNISRAILPMNLNLDARFTSGGTFTGHGMRLDISGGHATLSLVDVRATNGALSAATTIRLGQLPAWCRPTHRIFGALAVREQNLFVMIETNGDINVRFGGSGQVANNFAIHGAITFPFLPFGGVSGGGGL